MNNLLLYGIIFAIIVLALQFFKQITIGKFNEKEEWLPYTKKTYLLTRAEHEFFTILEQAVDNKYYIFPQLALDKLMLLSGKGSYRGGYRNKIDQKSVDFVLFDKQNISPLLVIELDDYTHERPDRQIRDGFVDRVMNHCKIPILHTNYIPKAEELKAEIISKIGSSF